MVLYPIEANEVADGESVTVKIKLRSSVVLPSMTDALAMLKPGVKSSLTRFTVDSDR